MIPGDIVTNDRNSRRKKLPKVKKKKTFFAISVCLCVLSFLLLRLLAIIFFPIPHYYHHQYHNAPSSLHHQHHHSSPGNQLPSSPFSSFSAPSFPLAERENPVCYLPVGEESQLSLLCQGRRATSPVIFTTPTLSRETGNGAEWDEVGNALYKWPTH